MRKMKWMKKVYAFVLAGMMTAFSLSGMNVQAADLNQGTASITINGNEGQTLLGKKFVLYKLFAVENAAGDESVNYSFHAPFEHALKAVVGKRLGKFPESMTENEVIDYIQSLSTNQVEGAYADQQLEGAYSEFRYFVEELRDEIVKEGISGDVIAVTAVNEDNSIVIDGLEYGYYIVDEISNVEGTHAAASLCMVSTVNPGAKVVIKSDYPSVIKKIQEDDSKDTLGENGWNDMADFEIGQTVPYKFVSNVPNMEGYDTYYYAWHDVMDEALTFQSETVSISIHSKSGKTYTLKGAEFKVETETENGETFQVKVQDLKAIIDREFGNGYGQEVVLRYDAVLNDKAADDTGRPGFENDVKLEFSNNPDGNGDGETGETPWDTVVCFTYKLNGLKMNNQEQQLAGAKFRLYSDKDCQNEVYVKKTEKGYNVINRDSLGGNDHQGGNVPEEAVEMISADDGSFTVFGLDGGTYWLKETEAPEGYRPIQEAIKIEVIPTFVANRNVYVKGQGATDEALKNLEFKANIRQFLDGISEENTLVLEKDVEEGSGNLTIVNKVGVKLPTAGSSMAVLMFGAGGTAMCYAVMRKRQEKKYEK